MDLHVEMVSISQLERQGDGVYDLVICLCPGSEVDKAPVEAHVPVRAQSAHAL